MGEKRAEAEKDASSSTVGTREQVVQGNELWQVSQRGDHPPAPRATSCPGSAAPAHPREGMTLQPGAFAQPSEVSAFSCSEAGAWNRCAAT